MRGITVKCITLKWPRATKVKLRTIYSSEDMNDLGISPECS